MRRLASQPRSVRYGKPKKTWFENDGRAERPGLKGLAVFGSHLHLSTSRSSSRRSTFAVLMSIVRLLPTRNSSQKRLDTPAFDLILLKVVEGFVFFLVFFRAAIASGLVTVILRTFSAPLPKLSV
jgi:hypothetical protein